MDVCPLVMLIVAVGGGIVWLWAGIARRERKQRFQPRAEMSPDHWFAAYMPRAGAHQAELIECLEILEELFEFSWTRLRPHDTFSGTLRLRNRSLTETEQECWSDALEDWWVDRGLPAPPRLPDDLGGVLLAILRCLRQGDREQGSMSVAR